MTSTSATKRSVSRLAMVAMAMAMTAAVPLAMAIVATGAAHAAEPMAKEMAKHPMKHGPKVKVPMSFIDPEGVGKAAGTITLSDAKDGVVLTVNLKGLPPGEHGFHMHDKGSCDPADKEGKKTAGQAAGGHFDPDATKAHKGPGGGGHKGDLPKLEVSDKGVAKANLEVPGLRVADMAGHALMIHAGGDNYADAPKPLGGGGDRIVCGVVPAAK